MVEIEYDAWVERANSFDQCQSDDLAGSWRGVLAPIGSELEVKGGWLKNGKEVIDPVKEVRSGQIRLNGYA
jgi:hypothetical protein